MRLGFIPGGAAERPESLPHPGSETMKRLSLSVVLVMSLLVALPAVGDGLGASASAAARTPARTKPLANDPESVIRAIYQQYSKEAGPAEAPHLYFSPSLYELWIDVQRGAQGFDNVGVDFDIFLDSQDLDAVTNVSTNFTADGKDKGTLDVTFTAFRKQKAVQYAMIRGGGGWRIDNISWGEGRPDLRQLLAKIKAKQMPSQ
jgi:hypothetical protein